MRKILLFGMLITVLISVSLLAACNKASTTTQSGATKTQATTTTPQTTVNTSIPTTQANWWDKFGTPQYGGEITLSTGSLIANFDNYNFIGADADYWYESLFEPSWTLDRSEWDMNNMFIPDQYWSGLIAESWQMNDPQTLTVKIKQGVKWQNKPPVNGREFTAYDVQAHYDRILGTGGGYTWKAPMFAGMTTTWESVKATDKYTVVFKFTIPSGGTAFQNVADRWAMNEFEAPEWVALGGPPTPPVPDTGGGGSPASGPPAPPPPASGPLGDWKQVVGTGAWMLTDFTPGSAMEFSRNPDYWNTDPRYPQNKLPYADKLTVLAIPDSQTQLAALRTGKTAIMTGINWQQSKNISDTNPELVKLGGGYGSGDGLVFKNQVKPFNDIRVREAMQMAIDRKALANSIYGGSTDGKPCGMVTQAFKGYCYAYEGWPQDLKDQYAYNPTKAKELLAEAGYPDGFKTNIVVQMGQGGGIVSNTLELIQAYKAYFFDIGIDMEIKTMDRTAAEVFVRAGKHDQMASGAGGSNFPPTRGIDAFYSKSPEIGASGTNDPVFDAARDKFWAANTAAEAAAACVECDKRVVEQHWGVWMVGGPSYTFCQPVLKGFSNEQIIFWGGGVQCSRLWINESK